MWEYLGVRGIYAVEAGAGVGRFASQVLDFCEAKLAVFYDALRLRRRGAIRLTARRKLECNRSGTRTLDTSRPRPKFQRTLQQAASFPMNWSMHCLCTGW